MRNKHPLLVAALLMTSMMYDSHGSETLIAGSGALAPAYVEDSYYALNQFFDRAFHFTVLSGGPYSVTELQIAAFNHPRTSGNSATFSINSDLGGRPGLPLVSFLAMPQSNIPQILELPPSHSQQLASNTQYWLVATTSTGQFNWNFGDGAFGEMAISSNGSWISAQDVNVGAFALLGTAVPEPSAIMLAAGLMLIVACRRH